jgi:hypothetical protein
METETEQLSFSDFIQKEKVILLTKKIDLYMNFLKKEILKKEKRDLTFDGEIRIKLNKCTKELGDLLSEILISKGNNLDKDFRLIIHNSSTLLEEVATTPAGFFDIEELKKTPNEEGKKKNWKKILKWGLALLILGGFSLGIFLRKESTPKNEKNKKK